MIFHNDTPDTTMDEDLAALGLPTLMEARQVSHTLPGGYITCNHRDIRIPIL